MQAAGIIAADADEARYRYAPKTEALAQTLKLLVFTYGSDVIGVTNLIHEQTAKNAQRFADAFHLRKEP